jgi:hypothetical protein
MLLGLVVASTASAQFEGVVTYQMGGSGETWQYMAKGNKARFEVQNSRMPGGAIIMDMSTNTYTMVMPAQKMYMTMPMNQTMANIPDSGRGKVTKAGSEVIAGQQCDDYVGTNSKGEKEATSCIAHGMGNFMWFGSSNPMMKQMEDRISGLSSAIAGGGFPLKYVKSNGETTMLATKIERKSLDASLFTPPADYHQMQMPAGMPKQ